MRKPKQTVSAVAELRCSAAAVWRILTREQGYKDWFGYPDTEDLVFVDPDFSIGAKLSFKSSQTMIITSLQPGRELSFSDSYCCFTFSIESIQEGVELSVTMDIYAEGRYEGADAKMFCAQTIKALKKAAGIAEITEVSDLGVRELQTGISFFEFLKRVFAGYRSPVSSKGQNDTGEVYSSIIDNSDMSVTIARRALLFSALLIIFFFCSIAVSLSFQRSDIVPSSGLSLFESDSVSKYESTLIRIGEKKQSLELKLSCQGERIMKSDGSVEYHYASVSKTEDDLHAERVIVVYDAYADVRKFAYIDTIQSSRDVLRLPASRKIKEGTQYYELADINIKLSPSMNLYEVEDIVGIPVSAYVVDKNGDGIISTLYFGKFFTKDIFSSGYKSQIIVVLNEAAGLTSVEYCYPSDENGPFPVEELSRQLRRQYASVDEYLLDRYAFEKVYLIREISPEQADLLLSVTGRLMTPLSVAEEEPEQTDEAGTDEEPEQLSVQETEQEEEPPVLLYEYNIRNPVEGGRTYYRYSYEITYSEGFSRSVLFRNERLAGFTGNTLEHINRRSYYAGMSHDQAVVQTGILPSAVWYDKYIITYFYGHEIIQEDSEEPVFQMSLTFSANSMKLLYSEFYQPPEAAAETEESTRE